MSHGPDPVPDPVPTPGPGQAAAADGTVGLAARLGFSRDALAGSVAGTATTLLIHPLDVLKTRLQLSTTAPVFSPGRSLEILRAVATHERPVAGSLGTIRALYRGLSPSLLGNTASWALYFFWYERLKRAFSATSGPVDPNPQPLPTSALLLSSTIAGSLTVLATNPIWVLKTRMLSSGAGSPGAYPSLFAGARAIVRAEGLRGFYRGLVPSLLAVSHGSIQFLVYERTKASAASWRRRRAGERGAAGLNGPGGLRDVDVLVCSAVSKIVATVATYPYQLVRARLQATGYNTIGLSVKGGREGGALGSLPSMVKQVYLKEGLLGFYKGFSTNIARVLPSSCVMFVVYERVRDLL